jgi:Fe-S-cluster containining protein
MPSEIEAERFVCDECGACCRSFPIFVTLEDVRREPRIDVEAMRLPKGHNVAGWTHQLFPLPFHEQCSFLDGMERCEIYESRPQVCRDFEAGDPLCQEARNMHGLPPLQPAE